MNRFVIQVFILLVPLFNSLPGLVDAQLFEDNQYVVSEMDYLGETLTDNAYAVYVNIPYQGVVQLELMDDQGKSLWITHYVKDRGKHRIGIKTTSLTKGQTYGIKLTYKGIATDYPFQVPEGPVSAEVIASN